MWKIYVNNQEVFSTKATDEFVTMLNKMYNSSWSDSVNSEFVDNQ